MALQLSDGFDSHAAGGTLSAGDPAWGAQTAMTVTAAAGKFGGNALVRTAGAAGNVPFSNTGTQIGLACYVGAAALFTASTNVDIFSTAAAISLANVSDTGVLVVKDGAGTTRITTGAGAATIPAGYANARWIEVDYQTNLITAYVDGVPVGSYSGTYTAPASTLRLGGVASAGTIAVAFDDFITWDASGAFFNQFGLPPQRIQLLRPNAPGTNTNWVPTSGANWAAVDSASWAGGVGVMATVTGVLDSYNFTDLPTIPGVVSAVVLKSSVQNTGSSPANLSHYSKDPVSGIGVSAAAQVVPFTATVLKTNLYRDPNGLAWTGPTVNAAEFGQVSA